MSSRLPCARPTVRALAALFVSATSLSGPLAVSAPQRAAPEEASAARQIAQLSQQVSDLRTMVLQLQTSVAQLQSSAAANAASVARPAAVPLASTPQAPAAPQGASVASAMAPASVPRSLPYGMTLNALLDTYYEYNFNDPIGRVNLLRAYDVTANTFALNQADLVTESAPDLDAGKRFGVRIDLQFGQATEALQGNAANEPRPEIYRNIFQAYGSYWFPMNGEPFTIDFGKWASSLGIEGNYTKDQINYSRSFWFDFLPFYHSGLCMSYQVNDWLKLNYWVVNGTEQTEAFNNFKDQLGGFVVSPLKSLSWTFNYYVGQEHPDIVYVINPGPGEQNLPTQQGAPFLPIPNSPNGHLDILDTYVTWEATSALTLAAEGDYVTERLYQAQVSPPQRVSGGALYARYQFTPRFAFAVRGEYLADPQGLYSGADQYLKELTLTTQYHVTDGFDLFGEWRRDLSNRPYFLTNLLYQYALHQDTLGVGLVWWIGQKKGAW
jgi:Putative beta-barrel porin-2, OmpL-like. bbp2